MFCPKCQEEIKENEKFCTNCGAPIEKEQMPFNEETADVPPTDSQPPTRAKSKKPLLIAIGVLVVFIAVGALLFLNLTSAKEIEDAIASGNANQVNSVYSEAYGNESKLKKYDKVVAEFIEKMKSDINSHDFDSEALSVGGEAARNYCRSNWGSLLVSDDSENMAQSVSSENRTSWEDLNNLLDSKTNYCNGLYEYKTESDYQNAISSFSFVIESDSEFEDTTTMIGECADGYISSVLKNVEESIANNDISGGLDLLAGAKDYLDECGLNSEEISNKINETLVSYAADYATKAEDAFKQHDVNAAIGNIEVAMEIQPDNGDYKVKYDTYQQYLPFAMYIKENCLKVDETGDFWGVLSFDEKGKANNNNQMNHMLSWYNNNSDSSCSLNAYYNLNGKYDKISGTLFLSEGDKNTSFSGWFKVYGDGKLIYESKKMSGGILPIDFYVKVTDVQNLRISFFSEGEGGFLGEGPTFGINNLTAQKNFPY